MSRPVEEGFEEEGENGQGDGEQQQTYQRQRQPRPCKMHGMGQGCKEAHMLAVQEAEPQEEAGQEYIVRPKPTSLHIISHHVPLACTCS